MADDQAQGCVQPAAGPMTAQPSSDQPQTKNENTDNGGNKMHVSVGSKAPDFEAAAYHKGGFKSIKLSDFSGKWVFLCFYPGDFTFV